MKNTVALCCLYGSLSTKTKIVIAGNHDKLAERNPTWKEIFSEEGLSTYRTVCNDNGIPFYGTP